MSHFFVYAPCKTYAVKTCVSDFQWRVKISDVKKPSQLLRFGEHGTCTFRYVEWIVLSDTLTFHWYKRVREQGWADSLVFVIMSVKRKHFFQVRIIYITILRWNIQKDSLNSMYCISLFCQKCELLASFLLVVFCCHSGY